MSGTGSSGSSKRLHEEAAHGHFPSASKYPSHEDPSTGSGAAGPATVFPNPPPSKPMSNPTDYHAAASPFELAPDAPRLPKVPRTESRDADKRSSPLVVPMYRMPPSSSTDLHSDHLVVSENRVDFRDSSKEGSRDLKMAEGSGDVKAEAREVHIEGKRDMANKSEKDMGRFENTRAGDDSNSNREGKFDREIHSADLKGDSNVVSGYLNWKDAKDYNRGRRYSDSSQSSLAGNVESWHISRSSLHGSVEVGKEVAKVEEREHVEGHGGEAVGVNKIIDFKGEEKFKDRDRKRKDVRHRDWGEREKDRRNNLQLGTSGSEYRESTREEREAERWDRERKDPSKEKERLKEREKDSGHAKREAWNGIDTDSLPHPPEKEVFDSSTRKTEPSENLGIEQKKQKDFDSWKFADREARDRRKERDADAEGPERRNNVYEKESDDWCTDVDGGTDREREVFNCGILQRKRMLRPRSSPQVGTREPRFRPRTQDAEGSQGKPEISTVVYKVGECMQELIKLWREYELTQTDKNGESSQSGPTLEIHIPSEHVTATNRQVRGGQLWGTDIYTDDSDLVAVLMHTGYCRPTASPPPSAIHELRATIQVLPPQDCYVSTLRNNVRSRAWGAAIGCSYCVQRCCIVKKGGGTIELQPCLTHSSTVEPTLAPVAVERTMTTRAAASNALRQQRFVREVTIQYNLCNEPWIKYSISIVADKGLKRPLYTSARLKKGEVLYLETHSRRYELCFSGEKMVKAATGPQMHEPETEKSHNQNLHSSNGERNMADGDNIVIDVFRWSRCKKPLPQKVMRSVGIPLPIEYLEVLEENLEWEDVQWSQTGVWIGGKEHSLARVHFLTPN